MKRIYLLLILFIIFNNDIIAQHGVVINSQYKPLTPYELELYARAVAAERAYNEQQFQIYKEKAYERLYVRDYSGFIYYSDYALSFGWYNDKMYYDRGIAYEHLHDYKKAKKEYRKAIKVGYYPAQQALEQCKENEKKWKAQKSKR